MTPALAHPKAFAVWFKDLDRWDPASFQGISWHWPAAVMKPIGSVLRQRKEKVDRDKVEFSDLQPVTIHFDGSMDRRKVDPNRAYTMDLFWAKPGDIVVAKIDLKNGAVGIVPDDWQNVVVTGHFAVYEPELTLVLPAYLHRIIQTTFFRNHLWRNKVGAEGRKEVKLSFFEAQKIPLPPLPVQRAVVEHWRKAQAAVAAAEKRVAELAEAALSGFVSALGLKLPKQKMNPKAFAVWWTDFLRWSVSYNQAALNSVDLARGKYAVVKLGNILSMVQYGTSEKANTAGNGVPVLRINNIKDGLLATGELKHIPLSQNTLANLRLEKGDILIIRTSGSKDLVGTCAVFNAPGEFVFASYLTRLRANSLQAVPEFLAYFINSPLGRAQMDAVSRQIMQNNVNSEELRNLDIPLPPLAVQEAIMREVAKGRERIAREKDAAAKRKADVTREVEEMILGTRPVK